MNELNGQHDFHIVGGSFGGSSLAIELLKKGRGVLIADFAQPGSRVKCAGGIEMDSFRRAGLDIPHEHCTRGILSLDGQLYDKKIDYTVVDRRELDRASFEKAISLGAKFARAKYLSHDPRGKKVEFLVEGTKETIPFNHLVLSNGFRHKGRNIFFEPYSIATVEIVKGQSPHPKSLMFIFESGKMNGYYWIFPMPGGRLNIGAGSVTDFPGIEAKLRKFKENYRLHGEVLARGGGVIPLYPALLPQDGAVTRFGNAAGMVQPITGEGLKYISRNSQPFAQVLSEGGSINSRWLTSDSFLKLAISTFFLRVCFCGGNSGMSLYVALAKLATKLADWRRI